MENQNRNVAVGVFNSASEAQAAVQDLHRAGFTDQEIGVASKTDGAHVAGGDDSKGSKMGEGALAGLATGAGVGGLWAIGIAAGFLPAIGPAIAGGILGTLLSSAAAGAAVAGLAGALIGLGIPEDEAEHYDQQFQSGKTIVTVRSAGRFTEAQAILSRFGGQSRYASNMAAGSNASRSTSKMTETASTAKPAASMASSHAPTAMPARTPAMAEGKTMQLREEELHVDKQKVQTGEVHLRKEVIKTNKTVEVPVEREELVIERHAVSGNAPAGQITESEEIRIPLKEERVQVTKTPVVREEVSVGKRVVKGSEQVTATLSREELRVEEEKAEIRKPK